MNFIYCMLWNVGVFGDLVAQGVNDEPFDFPRFASFVTLQTFLVAPVLHKVQTMLFTILKVYFVNYVL